MKIELNNPLPILSVNLCGIGLDIAYGRTLADTSDGESMTENAITLVFNFVIGTYSKTWIL